MHVRAVISSTQPVSYPLNRDCYILTIGYSVYGDAKTCFKYVNKSFKLMNVSKNKLSSAKTGSDQISLIFWKGDEVDFRVKIRIADFGFTTEYQNSTDKLKQLSFSLGCNNFL